VSGRAREITLSNPETWLTSTTKLYNTNSQGQVGRELLLSDVFAGIATAARSPQAPSNLNVVGSYESAIATWSAGDSATWRVFVDGIQSVSNVSTVQLELSPGNHAIQVCSLKTVGTSTYSSEKVEFQFEVMAKQSQEISVTNPGSVTFSATNFMLSASTNSNLDLAYESLTPLICSIDSSGSVRTINSGGCSINISQDGDDQFLPASDQMVSFSIVRPSPLALSSAKLKVVNLQAKLTWSAPGNVASANVTAYVVKWRFALKGKAFGTWKSKTVTTLSWTSPKYAKWTKLQVKVHAVGQTSNSPTYSGAVTFK
jgi:hypothetical protein